MAAKKTAKRNTPKQRMVRNEWLKRLKTEVPDLPWDIRPQTRRRVESELAAGAVSDETWQLVAEDKERTDPEIDFPMLPWKCDTQTWDRIARSFGDDEFDPGGVPEYVELARDLEALVTGWRRRLEQAFLQGDAKTPGAARVRKNVQYVAGLYKVFKASQKGLGGGIPHGKASYQGMTEGQRAAFRLGLMRCLEEGGNFTLLYAKDEALQRAWANKKGKLSGIKDPKWVLLSEYFKKNFGATIRPATLEESWRKADKK